MVGALEAAFVAANPVMVVRKTVERDCNRVHSGTQQAVESLFVEQETVGDKTPRETSAVQLQSYLLDVVAHQCLAAGEGDECLVRVNMRRDIVDGLEEIHGGHILNSRSLFAVAAAMTAVHIATQSTLPEEVTQLVYLRLVVADTPVQSQRQTFLQS